MTAELAAMVSAEVLRLVRRRGLMAWTVVLTVGAGFVVSASTLMVGAVTVATRNRVPQSRRLAQDIEIPP